jgi:hypothetical protein
MPPGSGIRVLSAVLGLLVAGLGAARMLGGPRSLPLDSLIAAGLAGLGVCLLWGRVSVPPEGGSASPDALRGVLGIRKLGEADGVQWALRMIPERLEVPGYAIAAVFLQNAYDRPRVVTVRLKEGLAHETGEGPLRVALKPAETGVLPIPVFLPVSLPRGARRFAAEISASAPEGEGARWSSPARRAAPAVDLEILGPHGQEPLNVAAYEWTAFRSIQGPGQSRPDLEPLRELETLQETG